MSTDKTQVDLTKHKPEEDGVTHINTWIKAKTELGKALSHFYESPFTHPYYGPFKSMEGFWQYIKSRSRPDELRNLVGNSAKSFGKGLEKEYIEGFSSIITVANHIKVLDNPRIKEMLIESTLPFDQYFIFGDGNIQIRTSGHEWIIAGFEDIRRKVIAGIEPDILDYSELEKSTKENKKTRQANQRQWSGNQ